MNQQQSTSTTNSAREAFECAIGSVAAQIGSRPLDQRLENWLNETYPADGSSFRSLSSLIEQGAREGWLCQREAGGISSGRAIKPGGVAGRFSVDVVRMDNVVGPHHVHTTGEIGMIVPIKGDARFDEKGSGWYVYGPDSSHSPSVIGTAYILYLLPDGAIEFTGR
jgi:Domain of unknown function (DUF4863)